MNFRHLKPSIQSVFKGGHTEIGVNGVGIAAPVLSGDWREQSGKGRWWNVDYKKEYWDGPCQVKIESKRGEFKREVSVKTALVLGGVVNGKKNIGTAPAK